MNKRPLKLSLLVLCIWMFACVSAPFVAGTSTVEEPTFTASPTLRPSATATPTQTPIPTPEGAGFVTPSVDIQFETSLEELPSGDYLVILITSDLIEDDTRSVLRYVSLDGQVSGVLASLNDNIRRDSLNVGTTMELSLRNGDKVTTFFVDFSAQEISHQFSAGCSDGPYGRYMEFLAFTCDGDRLTWYFVDLENEEIRAFRFPDSFGGAYLSYGTTDFLQVTNDLMRIPAPEVDAHCLFQPSTFQLQCFDSVPGWWDIYSKSPDGEWFLSREYSLLPLACIENPDNEICIPHPIAYPTSEDVNMYSLFQDILWFSDGSKILFVQGGQDPWETIYWVYDIGTDSSYVLGHYPNVVDQAHIGWVGDGEQFLIVDDDKPADQKIWLVSALTGQKTRVASTLSGIYNVVGLFHVP